MHEIRLTAQAYRAVSKSNEPFYILADPDHTITPEDTAFIMNKEGHVPDGVWGTFGSRGDDEYSVDDKATAAPEASAWTGVLAHSRRGHSTRDSGASDTSGEESGFIRNMFGSYGSPDITERVILLEDIDFGSKKSGTYRTRLNLFLDGHESAEVYLDWDDRRSRRVEYAQPVATDNHGFERNRLEYSIPIEAKKSDRPEAIRILTYTRPGAAAEVAGSADLLKLVGEAIGILNTSTLLRYAPKTNGAGSFERLDSTDRIDIGAKTLLLIHGTFVDTLTTFGNLLDLDDTGSNWLDRQLESQNGKYQQILAFDHPTILDSAAGNIRDLSAILGDLSFANPVDILSYSRGGLVAQYLANLKKGKQLFDVDRVATVCSANGVDWFTVGNQIGRYLSVGRQLFKLGGAAGTVLSAITFFAQQSAKFFLNMPGCRQMTPGDDSLGDILKRRPRLATTRYFPICANYEPAKLKGEKLIMKLLKAATYLFIPRQNDLVVATKNEFKFPTKYVAIDNYKPGAYRDHAKNVVHTRAFTTEVTEEIADFLQKP